MGDDATGVATTVHKARLIGVVTALMCALAGGAVWCVLALQSRGDLAAFGFLVAPFVVWQLRVNGFAGRWFGGAIAALCVLLAAGYAFALQAVASVASVLGLSMRQTLLQIDPATAISIASTSMRGWNAILIITAALFAAWATWRRGRLGRRDDESARSAVTR